MCEGALRWECKFECSSLEPYSIVTDVFSPKLQSGITVLFAKVADRSGL
jgi:hypothetical protein